VLPNEAGYRLQLAHRYSYVLPQPHLIAQLAHYSPVVELGPGTGWSPPTATALRSAISLPRPPT